MLNVDNVDIFDSSPGGRHHKRELDSKYSGYYVVSAVWCLFQSSAFLTTFSLKGEQFVFLWQ